MWTFIGIIVLIFIVLIIGAAVASLFIAYWRRRWVASQDPELLRSKRQWAAKQARALLQGQVDYSSFLEEFEDSPDPEIENLVDAIIHSLKGHDCEIERCISVLEGVHLEKRGLASA